MRECQILLLLFVHCSTRNDKMGTVAYQNLIRTLLLTFMDFPFGSDSKESTCNAGDPDSIPGLGRSPGGGHDNPLQYSCLENPQGQRSLAGCGPCGCKKSDTSEGISTAQHINNYDGRWIRFQKCRFLCSLCGRGEISHCVV